MAAAAHLNAVRARLDEGTQEGGFMNETAVMALFCCSMPCHSSHSGCPYYYVSACLTGPTMVRCGARATMGRQKSTLLTLTMQVVVDSCMFFGNVP